MTRHPTIYFTDKDIKGVDLHPDDPMVISVIIADFLIKKVLVDQGSLADLL